MPWGERLGGAALHPVSVHAGPHAVVAWRNGRAITRAVFEREAAALAMLLPERGHVLNLCTDRYRFMLGFAAAMQRRQVSLLPASPAPQVLLDLRAEYPDLYALTDGAHPELPCMAVPESLQAAPAAGLLPVLEDQAVLVLFTSGSTGKPKPVPKSWGPLVHSARAAGARLAGLLPAEYTSGATLIGTVPHQHSYGLESMVLLCLQYGMGLDASAPLYPADIRAAIERARRPRLLVTTPVHLRALLAEPEGLPAVDLILSATAPLPRELACQAEAAFQARLVEIYGSTETGQVATRRSAAETAWHCLDGVQLEMDVSGVFASGPAVQGRQQLHDRIEMTGAATFLLGARSADMVDVAGKRASLAQLTRILADIPGVQDGVFVAGEAGAKVARLAAIVVAPALGRAELLRELRRRIDPAFLPRPLIFAAELPRNALGKLPREALQRMLREQAT